MMTSEWGFSWYMQLCVPFCLKNYVKMTPHIILFYNISKACKITLPNFSSIGNSLAINKPFIGKMLFFLKCKDAIAMTKRQTLSNFKIWKICLIHKLEKFQLDIFMCLGENERSLWWGRIPSPPNETELTLFGLGGGGVQNVQNVC